MPPSELNVVQYDNVDVHIYDVSCGKILWESLSFPNTGNLANDSKIKNRWIKAIQKTYKNIE